MTASAWCTGLSKYEKILSALVFSTTSTEIANAIVEGPSVYLWSMWNWARIAACSFFWIGVGIVAADTEQRDAKGKTGSWDEGESMYYSVSLFCMWLRLLHLLAVHQDLGPLVVVIRRMMRDVLTFGGIWLVLLLAFACAMQGTGLVQSEECSLADVAKMQCWPSWWLWRVYYQSFGVPFFEELNTDSANAITVLRLTPRILHPECRADPAVCRL